MAPVEQRLEKKLESLGALGGGGVSERAEFVGGGQFPSGSGASPVQISSVEEDTAGLVHADNDAVVLPEGTYLIDISITVSGDGNEQDGEGISLAVMDSEGMNPVRTDSATVPAGGSINGVVLTASGILSPDTELIYQFLFSNMTSVAITGEATGTILEL